MAKINRDTLLEWDRNDPLRFVREEFQLPEGIIYLDGNSLGAMPKRAVAHMREVMETEWASGLITSWTKAGWYNKPRTVGDRVGRLIGAAPGQVVVADSTSINLFKVVCAALRMRPGRKRILSEAGNFPTDLYILQGICDLFPGATLSLVPLGESVLEQITSDVAVVVLTEVDFRTGKLQDMAAVTKCAHDVGALIIWDLAHSAGALPIELDVCNVDFAVGCTYKYLNAGPGSPAFVYAAQRHQQSVLQPLTGWWGHQAPFDFSIEYRPASDINRFLCGSIPILSFIPLEASLDIWEKVDIKHVREKSIRLTSLFIDLVDEFDPSLGMTVASPREPLLRGSQVALRHERAFSVMQALIAKGVIGDFRTPDITRFGFTPLTLCYADVFDAVAILRRILSDGSWQNFSDLAHGTLPS